MMMRKVELIVYTSISSNIKALLMKGFENRSFILIKIYIIDKSTLLAIATYYSETYASAGAISKGLDVFQQRCFRCL